MPERVIGWETQAIFRDVFDLSPDSIVIADASGIILLCNRKACEVSGYELGELIGRNSLDSVVPEERQRLIEELQGILDSGELTDLVYTYLRKDGSRLPVEFSVRWFDNFPGIGPCSLTIGRDISARIQYEKAYKTLLDHILHGILVFQEGKLVYANPSALKNLGFATEEIASFGKGDLFGLVHPDDAQLINLEMGKKALSEHPQGIFHFRIFDKVGQLHWMESSIANISYNGKPALQISLLDTTGRKKAEDALQKSMQRYQALAESAQDGIYIMDREDRFLYINRFGAKMMGKQPDDILGQLRSQFFSEDAAPHLRQARRTVYDTGQPIQVVDEVPTNQGMRWFSTWQIPLKNEQGEVVEVIGVARDVTAQKKAELTLTSAKEELEQRVSERTAELVASQEQLKRLTKKIVNAQEEERRRVARELHDEAGQALITLKLNMASLRDELSTDQERLSEQISNTLALIEETSKQIRALSHSLRPPVLDIAGINLSLEEYCNEFSSRTNIPVTYTGVNLPRLPDEISISLYRILQEGLTNIAKHAQATAVNVQLARNGTEIWLTISDNGQGFDFQTPTDGIGLLGMRERVDLLNGRLTISAEPGKGASLTACIDWKDEEMA